MTRRLAWLLALATWFVLVFAVRGVRAADGHLVTDESITFPVRVDVIKINGLVRTKDYVVRRELGFKEGSTVTKADLELALARLWNTTIFAHVNARVLRTEQTTVVELDLEDRWTLVPLFSFGIGGGAFTFRIGAIDNNLTGRYLEAAAQYQYFDGFHGGQASFREPRLFDQRVELYVLADRLVRPRPGFADRRTQAVVEVEQLELQDRIRFGVRVAGFYDDFTNPVDGPSLFPQPTWTFQLGPSLRVGRIDTVRNRQQGVSLEIRPSFAFTTSDVASQFVTTAMEGLAFAMPGERWNFAFRFRAANVSKAPSHLQLYAGGLDLVRGFPDNYVRTNAYALLNAEARFVAFDSTWVALLPTVFVDGIAAQAPTGKPGVAVSVGGGMRFVIPKFTASGLRADLAVPLASTMQGVTEAEMDRFGPVTPTVNMGSVQLSLGVYQFF